MYVVVHKCVKYVFSWMIYVGFFFVVLLVYVCVCVFKRVEGCILLDNMCSYLYVCRQECVI
jgi:hypothetical protein